MTSVLIQCSIDKFKIVWESILLATIFQFIHIIGHTNVKIIMPTLCISKKKIDKTETNYTRNIITVPLIFISSSASGGRLGE